MRFLLFLLLFSFSLFLSAKEFGSKKDGWTISLPDDWNTNPLLSALAGKTMGSGEGAVETKLTAFKGSELKSTVILNLISFESEANLQFNAKAVQDALEKEPKIRIVSQKKIKITNMDAVRIGYVRNSNRFIQYLLVNKGKLWSLLFICPREISSKIEKEIGGIAETFRLEQEKPQ